MWRQISFWAKSWRMPAFEYNCLVKSFKQVTPTVFEIAFVPQPAREQSPEFQFEAGQFVSVIVPKAGPNGRDLRRAYSIASSPEARPVELCVKLVEGGPGTNYLYRLREGDQFKGFAPYGDFTFEQKPGRRACFIATGTGIAPFRSMLLSEAYRKAPPVSAWLLMGVRTEDELVYETELSQISGVTWVSAVSQPRGEFSGFKGRVTDWLRAQGDSFPWSETEFYLCGNGAMITEIKALLADRGVAKDSIHQEKYY
jgi:CDP-4-dehydro-6-deoxyglucose reductase